MSKDGYGQGKPRKEGGEQMKKILKGAAAGAGFASLTRNPLVIVMGAIAGGAAAAFKDEFNKALRDAGHVEYGKGGVRAPAPNTGRIIPVKGARKPDTSTDGLSDNPFEGMDLRKKKKDPGPDLP